MRFSSAYAGLSDHSATAGRLIEVNFGPLPPYERMQLPIAREANSAAGRADRQPVVRRLDGLRRRIGFVLLLVPAVVRIGAWRVKTVNRRMRCSETPARDDRPQPAADGGSPSFCVG
jgi:hypothetical protein